MISLIRIKELVLYPIFLLLYFMLWVGSLIWPNGIISDEERKEYIEARDQLHQALYEGIKASIKPFLVCYLLLIVVAIYLWYIGAV